MRSSFLDRLGFDPDRFQLEAFDAIDEGSHVVVSAPTGSGKTLVASYVINRAVSHGGRAFYTTPIKALSNQKFHDLIDEYGRDQVGLLTGDNVINPDAPIVVMTTEVLRNMLYSQNPLRNLHAVVLDEVHYLQDSYRGPVWEEVIIHLPSSIQLIALSATVSNADELAEWIETCRGPTTLVKEHQRPVELENRYFVAERTGGTTHFLPILSRGRANPKGFRFDPELRSERRRKGPQGSRGRSRPKWRTPSRIETVQLLRERDLLPAIYFLFSRAACTDAMNHTVDAGIVLTSDAERAEITAIVEQRLGRLSDEDRAVLQYDRFLRGLQAGIAAHHAGMVPPMKEAVEACFVRGLVKVVFATETLALGINMPARTVVIEKLTKWTGERHELLTPAQYTQLTGRAGRRGIDAHGDAVVLWSPWIRFEQVAELASSRHYVLRSAFRPTYNMAANLIRRYEPEHARQLLNLSFAQFRADAAVVRGEQELQRLRNRRRQLRHRIERDAGPVEALEQRLELARALRSSPSELAASFSTLQPGDVLDISPPDLLNSDRDGGDPAIELLESPVAVLAVAYRNGGRVKVLVADSQCATAELTAATVTRMPDRLGSVSVPDPYLPHSMSFIYEIAESLERFNSGGGGSRRRAKKRGRDRGGAADLDQGLSSPVPAGVEKLLRRLAKMDADIKRQERALNDHVETLGIQFDRVISLLEQRGHCVLAPSAEPDVGSANLSPDSERGTYRDGGDSAEYAPVGNSARDNDAARPWALTPSGERLARMYHELDLLAVECLEAGLFDGLSAAEVAGLASMFVYEERGSDLISPWVPHGPLGERIAAVTERHRDLMADERRLRIPFSREPDAGFVGIAHAWAAGGDLDDVIGDEELTPGDFVRTARLLIDLLRQIGSLAQHPQTARAARAAADAVHRDLVAASAAVEEE